MVDDITGRNQTDEALRDANQFNIEIVSQAGEGIVVYDRDLRYLVWNRFMERITGALAEDVIGRNALDLFPHLREQGIDQLLKRALNGETVTSPDIPIHSTFTDEDGWVMGTYSPHRNARGEIIGVIATFQDITERKQAEEALQISESKYRLLHDSMMDAFASVNMDGRITDFNESFRKMLGYEPDELSALTYTGLTLKKWHAFEAKIIKEDVLLKGYSDIYEKEYLKKDGTVFPVEIRTFLLRNEAGDPIGMWAIVRDITERKRAEDALRESEQRLANIIDFLPDPTFVIDKEGIVIAWNKAIEDLTGIKARDILGKGDHEYAVPFYGVKRPVLVDLLFNQDPKIESEYNSLQRDGMNLTGEVFLPSFGKNGSYIWAKAAPLYDGSGNIVGAIESLRDITERKRSEEALKESEAKFRLLFERSADAMFLLDDEKFIDCNRAAMDMMKCSDKEELLNLHPSQTAPERQPDGRLSFEKAEDMMRKAFEKGTHRFEWVRRRKNGEEFPVEATLTVIPWGDRQILHLIIKDITERERAEEALRESEEKYRNLVERANDGISIIQDGTVRYANPALAEIWGGNVEEIVGRPFTDFIDPDEIPKVVERFQRRMANESITPTIYETLLRRRGGTKIFAELNAGLITFQGKPADLVIVRDITERKQAEEALRTSHQILDGIINAIPVRVFWKDRDLVYLGCNAIFAQDAGFSNSKDIVGKDDYQMGWCDQAELYRGDDRQVIESGRPKLLIEEPQTTPEGNTIVLLTSKIPLCNSEGEIIGVLGTYMDITERKRMESELRRSRDELELRVEERTEELARKNAEMERFIYTVSHDLRSPLVTVSGFVGLLKEDLEKGDSQRAFSDLTTINESITKMDRLLVDTLELSRIGRVINLPEDVPFGQIVQEALRQTAERIKSLGVAVYVAGDMPKVRVDMIRIVEVLVNLIENSVKYMGDQEKPEIDIGYRKDGEETVFFVKDNGIGIDPNEHEKVFGLFYKVDGNSEGTGAGLSIVKRIIEVQGGRIWIESELEEGCTVCFTLPLADYQ